MSKHTTNLGNEASGTGSTLEDVCSTAGSGVVVDTVVSFSESFDIISG